MTQKPKDEPSTWVILFSLLAIRFVSKYLASLLLDYSIKRLKILLFCCSIVIILILFIGSVFFLCFSCCSRLMFGCFWSPSAVWKWKEYSLASRRHFQKKKKFIFSKTAQGVITSFEPRNLFLKNEHKKSFYGAEKLVSLFFFNWKNINLILKNNF